ncbi:MAG: putative Ig domain-containing protein, partial [Candidatus Thermoplasmatota archaeon]|nr:putative Ig domain-containing protein [Candidatus Thermoplasmatota archaeon]
MTYGLTSTPSSGMRINPATGAIRWLDAVPGEYAVQITASDGEETITHDLTVEVAEPLVPPANKVPVILEVEVGNATAGVAFTLTLSGSDEDPWDAANLTFTLVSGP